MGKDTGFIEFEKQAVPRREIQERVQDFRMKKTLSSNLIAKAKNLIETCIQLKRKMCQVPLMKLKCPMPNERFMGSVRGQNSKMSPNDHCQHTCVPFIRLQAVLTW